MGLSAALLTLRLDLHIQRPGHQGRHQVGNLGQVLLRRQHGLGIRTSRCERAPHAARIRAREPEPSQARARQKAPSAARTFSGGSARGSARARPEQPVQGHRLGWGSTASRTSCTAGSTTSRLIGSAGTTSTGHTVTAGSRAPRRSPRPQPVATISLQVPLLCRSSPLQPERSSRCGSYGAHPVHLNAADRLCPSRTDLRYANAASALPSTSSWRPRESGPKAGRHTRGSMTIGVSPNSFSGKIGIRLEAIRLIFSAWVKLGWGWFSATFREVLFDYGLGAFSTSRSLL